MAEQDKTPEPAAAGPVKASVVIPTKNAGPLFHKVLDSVLHQQAPWPFEVVVVDSGSTDGTVEFCRARAVRLIQIAPEDFGHGRTRNLAVSNARGEFVAVITHDALPATPQWLAHLVAAVEQDPTVAGAFGRHLPYPEADPYTARDLALHFEGFNTRPAVQRMDDPQRYAQDVGYRQFLHFFSDNNACLRRSVWEQIPYPDVNFAEDQIWAKRIIEAGFAKAYAHDAAVFHSHSYSVIESGRRAFDESAAFDTLFGYNMCPTAGAAMRQTVRGAGRDILWSLGQPRPWRLIGMMARAPFAHAARQLGYLLGRRHRRLPAWLVDRISLDRSLKNSRR